MTAAASRPAAQPANQVETLARVMYGLGGIQEQFLMPLARIVRDRDVDKVEAIIRIITGALSPVIEILLNEKHVRREWHDDDDLAAAVRIAGVRLSLLFVRVCELHGADLAAFDVDAWQRRLDDEYGELSTLLASIRDMDLALRDTERRRHEMREVTRRFLDRSRAALETVGTSDR